MLTYHFYERNELYYLDHIRFFQSQRSTFLRFGTASESIFRCFSLKVIEKRWCCFACSHSGKVCNFLNRGNAPVIKVRHFIIDHKTIDFVYSLFWRQLKEKKGR